MNDTYTLRPGLLVNLSTSTRGNVSYATEDPTTRQSGNQEDAEWRTHRTIRDVEEHKAAGVLQSRVRTIIGGVCAYSQFGLICPQDKAEELRERIAQAKALADEFNATAKYTRFNVNVLTGRIARDDVEAIREISGETRRLIEDMASGLNRLDPKAVRAAADRLVSVSKMLDGEAKEQTSTVIAAARAAATKIVKAGEQVATKIDEATIGLLESARTNFLDLEEQAGGEPVINVAAEFGRGIDLEADVDYTPVQVPDQRRALDLEEVN